MEVFAITFSNPVAPVKEHTPSRVRDRLGKVSVLYHIARFKFLCDNRIKTFVVEKGVSRFCDEVKTLAGDNIRLFCQCVFRLIPSSALVLLARQVAVKFHEFVFRLAIKARVGYLLTIRSRQKVLYAYIHTTSRLRNTGHRIRHFANDKAIPAACRLFQRDLFRVSDEPTVLADFDFTEFRNFQPIEPRTCFTDRGLADTFTRLKFVFAQGPRERTNRGLVTRVSLFLQSLLATALKMLMCCVNTFDRGYLHILRMLGIVRVRLTEFCQMVNLVITRHRFTAIIPHLRTHLEHVVLELLLVFQLRKKPRLLGLCRIYRIFECAFHNVFTSHAFNPVQVGRQTRNLAVTLELSANVIC